MIYGPSESLSTVLTESPHTFQYKRMYLVVVGAGGGGGVGGGRGAVMGVCVGGGGVYLDTYQFKKWR